MADSDPFANIPGVAQPDSSGDPFANIPGTAGFDSATGAPVAKPAPPAKLSFGQRAKEFVKAAPAAALQLGTFGAAATLGAAPGAAALAGGTALKAVTDQAAVNTLEKISHAIQPVDLQTQTQKYFDALAPGLRAKGWTDEHIMQEARQRASNVAMGAQATKDSIDQDVQQTRAEINQLPGEAITNTLFMAGTPKVLGALGAGLAKVGTAAAGKVGLEVAAKPITSTAGKLAVSALKHAATGGIVGGIGMGAGRASDRALEAWAADKPSDEIAKQLVKGFKEGGVPGAVIGGVLGGAVGGAAGAVEAKAAAKEAAAQAMARDLADKSAAQIAERDAAITNTADSFNPHTAGVPADANPYDTATTIIQQAHGDDAATSLAGIRAADKIATRIKLYQDANEALQGNIVPQEMGPTQGRLSGVQPVGAPLQPEGGLAPEPGLPEAVQGPLGQPVTPAPPPAQVTPVEGLEGAVPVATDEPSALPVTGLQPEQPFPGQNPPRLAQPLGPVANAAGVETNPPIEPRPVDLGPVTPLAPVPPPPPVEGMDLVHRAIEDAVNAGENGKALKLAEKYGLPVDKKVARLAVNDLLNEGNHEGALKLAEKTGLREAPEPKAKSAPKAEAPAPEAPKAVAAKVSTPKPSDPFADIPGVKKPLEQTNMHEELAAATPAPEANVGTPTQEPTSRPGDEAAKKLAAETHATVTPTEDGQGVKVQLGVKPGEVAKPGGPATALDNIVRAADEHGVRVETDLVPAAAPKGGKIPLEKLIPWYEARGFKVVESTKIPEGNLATAKLVREPIGLHQNEVASALEKVAEGARKRLNAKLGRANAGFDPTMIGDAALELSADMFSRRLRDKAAIESWAVQKWGDVVKPFLSDIITKAQKHFVRMFKEVGSADKNLTELLALHESGKYGMGWYENTADWARKRFGQDADMFLRFLAVTSANGQTESGAAMALKAFAQWKSGMDFEGFRGDSMVGQLKKSAAGEPLPENSKIGNFLEALRGNPDAVVLDRWMLDALNLKEKGGSLRPKDYAIYEQVVKNLARDNDMTPRQFQAAVWESARVRKAHTSEATVGRSLTSKIGSSRPLEELVDRKLGGLSIDQYVADTAGKLKMMDNLYKALAPVRKGIEPLKEGGFQINPESPSGHSFNPETFEPAAHEGYVVSLVSNSVQRGHMYPARVLKFRDDIAPLLQQLQEQGRKPTIGVWQEVVNGKPTGNVSLDLNVTMKDEGQALELGKLARNHEIAKLGKGGEWQGNLPTGYDPAINGKQFLPPKDFKDRAAWHKQQMNRARTFLKAADAVKPKGLLGTLANERGAVGSRTMTAEMKKMEMPAIDKTETSRITKAMMDRGGETVPAKALEGDLGNSRMGSYWISPDGKVIKVPEMHSRNAKAVLKATGIPDVTDYEGASHGAGSEVQALLNRGFIRIQMSGSMAAFDLSRGITDEQRALIKRAISNHEDWAAAISDRKGQLINGLSSGRGDKPHHFLAEATGRD